MEQQHIPNNIWLSPFFVVKLETPTGNPKYGRLTVEIVRHCPHESIISFTTQTGKRMALPLTEECSIFYAEYDGRRYPIYMKMGKVFSIFHVSVLDVFLKIAEDTEQGVQ